MHSSSFEATKIPDEISLRFSFANLTLDDDGAQCVQSVAKTATGKVRVVLKNTRPRKAFPQYPKPLVLVSPKNDGTDTDLRVRVDAYDPVTGNLDLWFTAPAPAGFTITCDTNANMADGNTVTLDDGFRKVTYEYDKSANGVAAGNVNWAAGAGTAAQTAATLKTAIEANQTAFIVTDNADGTLTIVHRWPGTGGNRTNSKSAANALAVTDGTGGSVGALRDPDADTRITVQFSGSFHVI